MNAHTSDRTLYALYCLSRQTLPIDAGALGRITGKSATQTGVDLVQLEYMGCVDASRARLTMLGLARALRLGSRFSGGPRDAQAYTMRRRSHRRCLIKPPVAAKSTKSTKSTDSTPGVERRTDGPVRLALQA